MTEPRDKPRENQRPGGKAGKRIYRRPELRVFGAVHLLTRSTGSLAGDAMTMMMLSDRAAKRNFVRIGEHPLGFGLYLFEYKPQFRASWGRGRRFGVMADEVAAVLPAAVATRPDGIKVVDYAMLGIATAAR